MSYYFRSNPSDSRCWFRKITDVTMCLETGKPSVEFVLNVTSYTYKRAWNVANSKRRHIIEQLWKSLITNYTQLNCLSTAIKIERDNMSLNSLATWSDPTIEKSESK